MTRKIAKPHKWTAEQIQFFKENVKGTRYRKLREMINEKFDLQLTLGQITGFADRNNLKNGIDMTYKKDVIPWNKGMKGLDIGGKETRFKKGQPPINYRPVGSERITVDGYTEIKIKDPSTWRLKHNVIWERHNGKIPKGNVVVFADCNKQNFDLDNLLLISRSELARMNQQGLFSDDPELTKAGLKLVRLNNKITHIEIYGGDKEKFKKYVRIAEKQGLSEATFIARLKRGWSLEDALYKPLQYVPKRKERSVSN